MTIKQFAVNEGTVVGLGEDNKMYVWLGGEWVPFGWEPKPAQFVPASDMPHRQNPAR